MKYKNLKKIVGHILVMLITVLTTAACSENALSEISTTQGHKKPAMISISNSSLSTMPTLHKIETYTFQAPYSCNGSYEKSALFLSDFSRKRNSPDLLFNGACRSPLYIQASTAGDDFSLISDLGKVSLETISASKSFNYDGVVDRDNSFKEDMPVTVGHSYVVLIAKRDLRALYALHVDDISSDGIMKITYAVKSYSIQSTESESPGFDWEQGNQ